MRDTYINTEQLDDICYTGIPRMYSDSFVDGMSWLIDEIENLETIKVRKNIMAKWIVKNDKIKCSNCKRDALVNKSTGKIVLTPFCGFCGADLREDGETCL